MLLFDNSGDDMEKLKLKIVALEEEKLMLLDDIDKLNTNLREGNKERQSLSDRFKELEEKVKYLMNEVKCLNEELKKHQKIDYDIKAGQVAYCFEQCHKHSKLMMKQTSRPCCFY